MALQGLKIQEQRQDEGNLNLANTSLETFYLSLVLYMLLSYNKENIKK
jgi:hypothetical protein